MVMICVQGSCGLASLDYLKNGHKQDGAASDGAGTDVAHPITPSPDVAILDGFQSDTLASGGAGGIVGTGGEGPDGAIAILDAPGAGGTTGFGGAPVLVDTGGGTGGSGGGPGLDGPADTRGSVDSGGNASVGGAIGLGGFTSSGGFVGAGGSTTADSGTTPDLPASSGGIEGTGGVGSAGGTVGTGGALRTGGTVGTGGNVGTGGASTGGTSAAVCGTTKSAFAQTITFGPHDGGSGPLVTSPATPPTGAQLTYTTVGPAANPTLCAAGCAALSMTYAAGTAAYATSVSAIEYLPDANLVGATITFTIAVDNPGTKAPIQLQAYATGDASTLYSWSAGTNLSGAGLLPYAAANTPVGAGKAVSTTLADNTGRPGAYCASATRIIGLQLQNTSAITATNAGPVTIYITSVTIAPAP